MSKRSIVTWTTTTTYQELGEGFIQQNTAVDMQKCVRLFQDCATVKNARFLETFVSVDCFTHSLWVAWPSDNKVLGVLRWLMQCW